MILKIGIITPVMHINNIYRRLNSIGDLIYLPEPNQADFQKLCECNILFTNPNKSRVYLNEKSLNKFSKLKFIVTASTGTIHIDKEYCKKTGIEILSIGKEYDTLKLITSTAELALTGTLVACRNFINCVNDAKDKNNWNYENYIGRQISGKNVGVIGFGRLGSMYSKYMRALGANLFIYEKYNPQNIDIECTKAISLEELFENCEIISIHIHADMQNLKLINDQILSKSKENLILVNTSRGEIVDEFAIIKFLKRNKYAIYVTDVISNETFNRKNSPLYETELLNKQIIISQHIGGMTNEAQEIAYNKAIDLLEYHLKNHDRSIY